MLIKIQEQSNRTMLDLNLTVGCEKEVQKSMLISQKTFLFMETLMKIK